MDGPCCLSSVLRGKPPDQVPPHWPGQLTAARYSALGKVHYARPRRFDFPPISRGLPGSEVVPYSLDSRSAGLAASLVSPRLDHARAALHRDYVYTHPLSRSCQPCRDVSTCW
jgi:hypothetical protein